MKKRTRLTALILCAAMILSLFGCTGDPAPTQPPTDPPAPTQPPALLLYEEAVSALEGAADVTLTVSATTRTHVAGELLSKGSDQVLVYAGLDTDSPAISSADSVNYDGLNFMEYREVYTGGTFYLDAEDVGAETLARFCTEMSAEDAAARYLPAVLLDAALYGSVTMEETEDGTVITFADPSAPESWAAPEQAELVEAAGTALLDGEGALKQYTYEITYKHGASKVIYTVSSEISPEASPIYAPAGNEKYISITDPDAIRLCYEASCYAVQADKISSVIMESMVSQAAGLLQNQSITMDMCVYDTTVDSKIITNVYRNILGQSEEFEMEELFLDNHYTSAVDGGEPEWDSSVTAEMAYTYGTSLLYSGTVGPDCWEDVTLTDLGSVYLLEFTLTTKSGWEVADYVCDYLFDDPDALNNDASARNISEARGYFAVDKFTHLPTAAGFNLDAYHVIDLRKVGLTYQVDQSYDIPGLGAYHTITDKYPKEARPIDLATPLFYHVTGDDGQEMWLLGTIHVGDNRTAFLPREIYDAFAASDALALEYDSVAFEDQLEEDDELMEQITEAYYYSDGTTAADHLDEEQYGTALQYLKATGNYNMNAEYMKPYLWSSSIEDFFLRQGYSLTRDQGVESRLEQLAEEQDKEIRSVESGLFQIRMLTGYSDELQEWILSDTVQYDAMEYWTNTDELFDLWCRGDEAALRAELADDTSELTEEELALYNEYNDAMLVDRNAGMLDVAIDYLESGDVVFYAVGLAHLISGGNGLVDTLREAGYTVELVTYAE